MSEENMIFHGLKNEIVEFSIQGYQFPDATNVDDANWLNVNLKADANYRKWEATDPALTTHELQKIINWFTDLVENKIPKNKILSFLEQNITFELIEYGSEVKKIQIEIAGELTQKIEERRENLIFQCELSQDELTGIVTSLREELTKYPLRQA
jgi:DNA integrity scanning protein DisA with diadenylate cyclase activity